MWTVARVCALTATTLSCIWDLGLSFSFSYVNPLLAHKHQKRLILAKDKKDWMVAQWFNVLFADKRKCNISIGSQNFSILNSSPVWNFHSRWRFMEPCHQPLFIHCLRAAIKQEISNRLMFPGKFWGDADFSLPFQTLLPFFMTIISGYVLDWLADLPDPNPTESLWCFVNW